MSIPAKTSMSKLVFPALVLCGFLGAQRFAITPADSFVCLIPLFFFVVHAVGGDHKNALISLTLALILSIDNGGGIYAETNGIIRYSIYIIAIFQLCRLSRMELHARAIIPAITLFLLLLISSVNALYGYDLVNAAIMQRDLLVLVLLSAFLFKKRAVDLDLSALYAVTLGYVAGELFNVVLFYRDLANYLNYNSVKVFVLFPLIYTIRKQKPVLTQIGVATCCSIVVFSYGSRMIVLSFIVLLLVYAAIKLIRLRSGMSLIWGGLICLVVLEAAASILFQDGGLARLKALSFLGRLSEITSISNALDILAILDPVRFAEHQLFFDRSTTQVLFGSGLGSGIFDAHGLLGFMSTGQALSAFTSEEVGSSIYYNFHDSWLEFSIRFGVLPVLFIFYRLILLPMWRGEFAKGGFFGLLLVNTTFSTAGIILTALMVRFWPILRDGTSPRGADIRS